MRSVPALLLLSALLLSAPLTAQVWPASEGVTCRGPALPEGRTIEGEVLDLLTLRPVGGVAVTLRSTVGRRIRILGKTTSGSEGRYVFCGVPSMEGLNVTGELMAETSRSVPLHDDPSLPAPPIYIRWSRPADLSGQVLDGVTGDPVSGVQIELEGRPVRSLTDEEGRFRILGQGAGQFIVRSSHLGYVTRTDTVDVASGDRLDLEIYLFETAVELAPIVVRVRSELEEERRASASRFDAMTEAQIDSLLPQVTDMGDLLRAGHFPGVDVVRSGLTLCIEVTRGTPGCNTATVFVNGVRLVDPSDILDIPPEAVARIQILDPQEGMVRFGPTVSQHGVILITLR